ELDRLAAAGGFGGDHETGPVAGPVLQGISNDSASKRIRVRDHYVNAVAPELCHIARHPSGRDLLQGFLGPRVNPLFRTFPVLDLCIRFPESKKSNRRATNAFSIRASVTAIGLRPRNVSRALQVPDRLLPCPRPDLPENVLDV